MATTVDEQVDAKVDAKVRDGLTGTAFEPASVQRLSGGLVNWGYRATLKVPLDDGTDEVFLKHGETWVAKIPDYELNLVRCVRISRSSLAFLLVHLKDRKLRYVFRSGWKPRLYAI